MGDGCAQRTACKLMLQAAERWQLTCLAPPCPFAAGVLPELLGRHDNPWWLSRAAVAGLLTLAVIVPLCVPRSLASVARFSKLSVACVCALTVRSSSSSISQAG